MDKVTQLASVRPQSRTGMNIQALSAWGIALFVFCFSFVPRAVQGSFVTVDEAFHWFDRCEQFLQAIRSGNYAGTKIIGHPGVTTMWLGAIGVLSHETLARWGLVAPNDPNVHRLLLRLPVAFVTSICVALAYLLLRRLVDRRVALLAALFWAADPFLVAHSQLLHLDALLTSFINLALLAAMVAFRIGHQSSTPSIDWRALTLSGITTGLALLTKSPSIILIPMVGLIAIVGWYTTVDSRGPGRATLSSLWSSLGEWKLRGMALLVWFIIALATWFALWPALWVDLPGAISLIVHQASSDGGSPHGWGNFFMGHTVADPGPLFYPVAIALRMTPWSLIGVVIMLVVVVVRWRSVLRDQHVLGLLAIFALLFTTALILPPKKFDRYVLPIFPALDIIAAAGLIWLIDRRRGPGSRVQGPGGTYQASSIKHQISSITRHSSLIWLTVVLGLAANLAWYHPYAIAYYNPLLGGGPVAAQLIPIGWGEGYEQAGAYITAQPDGQDRPIAAWFEPVLRPYVKQSVVALTWIFEPGKVDYAMLYIDQIQRNDVPQAIQWLRSQFTPIYTVRIHGIDYAYIYQIPQPVTHPLDADFGSSIHLRGYNVDASAVRASGFLTITLDWQARGPVGENYTLFAHVVNAKGTRVGQADLPPGGTRAPSSTWQPAHYITSVLRIPMQSNAPKGTYWIAIGLYDPTTSARLPLHAPPQPEAPGDGADALLLEPITLP